MANFSSDNVSHKLAKIIWAIIITDPEVLNVTTDHDHEDKEVPGHDIVEISTILIILYQFWQPEVLGI